MPPFLHACATRVPWSDSLFGPARLTDSRVPNQGAKLGANATKRTLQLSRNSTRPSIPKALETLDLQGLVLRNKPAPNSGGKEAGKPQSRAALSLWQGVCGAERGARPTGTHSLRLSFTPCLKHPCPVHFFLKTDQESGAKIQAFLPARAPSPAPSRRHLRFFP